jgi:outer membrane protein assembly factor BamA
VTARRDERPRRAAAAVCGVAVLAVLLGPAASRAQTPPSGANAPAKTDQQAAAPSPAAEEFDLVDLWRRIRHRELTPEQQAEAADPKARMRAIAPVIGYKPSSGAMIGVAGNMARFLGDPKTTRISSSVMSLTFSSKKQTSLTVRFGVFSPGDRWSLDGDNRLQWTSQDTFGLGTITSPDDKINMKFDYIRVYNTAYRKVYRNLHAGVGFHYSARTGIGPGKDAESAWADSPFVTYSERHGFPLDSQTSAGTSVNARIDTRDNGINPNRGWLAGVSYRPFFKGFLGGDSTWQELYLDTRTYRRLDARGRHKLAFWLWGDIVTGGIAPYMDLPATGMDTYGRSARGYAEGRLRGERLLYGEVEYRATLTDNGFLGMVVFLNTTTLANSETGERLFDNFAPGAGAGLRVRLNKRSKTNLCFDFGVGRQGSRGIYLAVQEAF